MHSAKRQAPPAQLARHREREIPGPAQVVEVFLEEPVLAVVAGRAVAEALEHRLGQDRGRGRWGHDRSPPVVGFVEPERSCPSRGRDRARRRPPRRRSRGRPVADTGDRGRGGSAPGAAACRAPRRGRAPSGSPPRPGRGPVPRARARSRRGAGGRAPRSRARGAPARGRAPGRRPRTPLSAWPALRCASARRASRSEWLALSFMASARSTASSRSGSASPTRPRCVYAAPSADATKGHARAMISSGSRGRPALQDGDGAREVPLGHAHVPEAGAPDDEAEARVPGLGDPERLLADRQCLAELSALGEAHAPARPGRRRRAARPCSRDRAAGPRRSARRSSAGRPWPGRTGRANGAPDRAGGSSRRSRPCATRHR